MKKSEAIKYLGDYLATKLRSEWDPYGISETILEKLKTLGMLPPPITKNEWEEENDRPN